MESQENVLDELDEFFKAKYVGGFSHNHTGNSPNYQYFPEFENIYLECAFDGKDAYEEFSKFPDKYLVEKRENEIVVTDKRDGDKYTISIGDMD